MISTNRLAYISQIPTETPSYAIIDDISVETSGIYAEVTLLPSRRKMNCRVGMVMASSECIAYFPYRTGDRVVVVFPNNTDEAPVIIARLNNEEIKMPDKIIDNPEQIYIKTDGIPISIDGGNINLNGDNRGVARQDDEVEIEVSVGEISVKVDTNTGIGSNHIPIKLKGKIISSSQTVKTG